MDINQPDLELFKKNYIAGKNQLLFQTLSLILISLLFVTNDLFWSFSVYFVLWHSLPSLNEQSHELFPKEKNKFYNSLIAVNNNFEIIEQYNKQKLVPFGEYIPFERILRGLIDFFDLPMSQVRPGKNNITSLKVGDYIFSPFICFDISFENLFRKNIDKSSIFVINVSNDSWFGNSIGPYQHLEILKTRANENKIFILR